MVMVVMVVVVVLHVHVHVHVCVCGVRACARADFPHRAVFRLVPLSLAMSLTLIFILTLHPSHPSTHTHPSTSGMAPAAWF